MLILKEVGAHKKRKLGGEFGRLCRFRKRVRGLWKKSWGRRLGRGYLLKENQYKISEDEKNRPLLRVRRAIAIISLRLGELSVGEPRPIVSGSDICGATVQVGVGQYRFVISFQRK